MSRGPVSYVIDVVEEFLRTKAAREKKTRASYSGILLGSDRGTKKPLGQPFAVYFHNRKFASLTHDEVATWFALRVEAGRQNTKHRISKEARHFLTWAHKRDHTSLDLASAIEPFRSGESRLDWLSWSDVDRVLAALPEFRLKFAAAWLFYTGCRIGEALAAVQADIRWREDFGMYEWTISDSKTHRARTVWLPSRLGELLDESRRLNKPQPTWPILWDCEGRGFGRVENPAARISERTVNNALARARDTVSLTTPLTAHVCRHTYCTNYVKEYGHNEYAMEKLSRLVGTSVGVLRNTYVHLDLTASDWDDLRSFGRSSKAQVG
jgi:integrase